MAEYSTKDNIYSMCMSHEMNRTKKSYEAGSGSKYETNFSDYYSADCIESTPQNAHDPTNLLTGGTLEQESDF